MTGLVKIVRSLGGKLGVGSSILLFVFDPQQSES
jgi:hypothetical protein